MQSTITVSDGRGARIHCVCARVDLLLTCAAVSIGAQVAGRRAAATTGRANTWSVGCAPSARDGSEILTQLSAMGNMCGLTGAVLQESMRVDRGHGWRAQTEQIT